MSITLEAIQKMNSAELFEIVRAAAPLDLDAIADTTYTGIDLSLPSWMHSLLWKSFRKTFHRDPVTGVLRGWNVKVQQTGWDAPPEPRRDKRGRALSFGHYEVCSARGLRFPRAWKGEHYLDYGHAGNPALDPAALGYCPLVSVNAGDSELLLGWEVFKLGSVFVPLNDFWVLKREGPLKPEDVVPRPDARPSPSP
jgi:hypothetical protein